MSDDIRRIPISDITPDTMNANAHTERGEYMLDNSYGKFGNRGAIVLDKNLRIPAGNHRHEKAGQNGIEEVVVIKGDPNKLYAIQYDDFDLDDPNNPAREFAVADNRTAEVGINLEPDVLKAYHDMGVELGDWFTDLELDDMGIDIDEPDSHADTSEQSLGEQYMIIIELENEAQQTKMLDKLMAEGYQCKALIS